MALDLSVALVHYPVLGKHGESIAAAVTNLDLHDIARAAKTYGAGPFYVVTPLTDQQRLVEKLAAHWQTGVGAIYNPHRKAALDLIRVMDSMESMLTDLTALKGRPPVTVATSAKKNENAVAYGRFKQGLGESDHYLLLFGTAWGLTDDVMANADIILTPIMANSTFNHLSVRSAVSIILDRLAGDIKD